MKKRQKDLQDIYLAPKTREEEADYNWKMPPELENQVRRTHRQTALLALIFFGVVLSLAVLLTRDIQPEDSSQPFLTTQSAERQFTPHYSLPEEENWVLMYAASIQKTEPENEEDRPLSTKWVKNVAYHVIMGHQSLLLENYAKSAAHFEKVLLIFPAIRGVHEPLGTAHMKQNHFEAAIEPLREAIRETETFPALSNLGVALFATEHLQEAEGYLLQALALQPNHPGCPKNLAFLYQKMELSKKALSHFETYFSLHPEDFNAIKIYAEYLTTLGQPERATSFLKEVCQQERTDALPLHLLLAKVEAQATNEVQAVDALRNITRYLSPNLAIIEMNRTDFDSIRDTEAFQGFLHQLELKAVSLENRN